MTRGCGNCGRRTADVRRYWWRRRCRLCRTLTRNAP
jgi:hypothetical protein